MIFNSLNFVYFIVPVLFFYWYVFNKKTASQNIFLLISSLFFYAFADWRFLILLIVSIFINYYLGLKIRYTKKERTQRHFLYFGLIFNISLLLYFKYFNFFYEGFVQILNIFGDISSYNTLSILIPLGISFFTFQTLGYLIDVYNEEVEPSNNILEFSLFVSYFPKILSGPIERASKMMPQIREKRNLSYNVFVDGLRQILWGLFAKIVIAENCSVIVNPIFDNYKNEAGITLLIGALFYAIQLYADFSGYSNMAIGVSKLFGIKLMRNFSTPFFSTNISDYWRKWHISLTTWMMDFVFTPLSFSLRSYKKRGLAISIITTFILVGFWHGPNWTFIVYGLLHGLYFLPLVYSEKMNTSQVLSKGKHFPNFKEFLKMVSLFFLVAFTDVFFRSNNLKSAFEYIFNIFNLSDNYYNSQIISTSQLLKTICITLFFFTIEWVNKEKDHDFQIGSYHKYVRWGLYYFIFILIISISRSSDNFIYFKF
ncbi:MBOAT family protein [Algibacter sp.]|nr:MBOAT family protein [Algibacter sp.]